VTSDAVGALILAQYEGDTLVATGRAGTGFTARTARDLYRRLAALRRPSAPFAGAPSAEDRRKAVFVEPEVVVEVEFRNWTAEGALRHPVFRGLREDKPPREVRKEGGPPAPAPAPRPAAAIRLTHPDRLYWPEAGVTKEGLAEYYAEVWPQIAPSVVGRPLSLLRCPEGIAKACFFQKHAWKGQSRAIQTLRDPLDRNGESLLAIDGLDGLVGLVQGGVLEIHPWQSSLAELEKPDQIVMDLDPGEDVAWGRVIEAAHAVRARLQAAGLAGFVKTSGGKGLHVVAPLAPRAGWVEVKGFARGIAEAMAADEPGRFVATITKSKRRGRILVDYLRNGRGATAVAAFSTRARAGAPVSMPLAWDELDANLGPAYFTVRNAAPRIAALAADPWAGFRAAARPIETAGTPRRRRKAG
jgi:bifunctional non-homologous end joining protein LigD